MNILGIETSCDETAAAIVTDKREILSNLVLSQIKEHAAFGGVVPEIAARAHMDHLDTLIKAALDDAKLNFDDLDGVAATCGPGLIGGVMVGMMAGKSIAAAKNLPFIAVNHLEGHALTPRLTDNIEFPYLLLLISGGHTQILVAEGVDTYKRWGTTLDDAAGECFDKSAKLMGLPYPGGPNLEKMAAKCINPGKAVERFPLPRPMKGRKGCDFSFSGLKTAIRVHVEKLPEGDLKREDVADLACAFQSAMAQTLVNRCENAIERFKKEYYHPHPNPPPKGGGDSSSAPSPRRGEGRGEGAKPILVVSGGVAANSAIREALNTLTVRHNMKLCAPPLDLCSDNAAMIAWAGLERLQKGMQDGFDFKARPRWPLDRSIDLGTASRQNSEVKA